MIIDKKFFNNYQKTILRVINHPLGRKLMGVEKMGHKIGNRVVERVTPNSIRTIESTKYLGNNKWLVEYKEHFFINPAYGQRLGRLLFWMPVGEFKEAMGDMFIMRPAFQLALFLFLNLLSFKLIKFPVFFGTTTTFNGSTNFADGNGQRSVTSETFATIRAGAGNAHQSNPANNLNWGDIEASSTTNQFDFMLRGIASFDTSSIGSSPIVSAATFSINSVNPGNNGFSSTIAIALVGSTPANVASIANSDYGNVGSTRYCDTDIPSTSWPASGYSSWVFNSTGRAAINKTGTTSLAGRTSPDLDNSAPTWMSGARCNFVGNSWSNGSNLPNLVITYAAVTTNASLMMGQF